ncbi:hypothetical protein Tco_1310669 [Tanacetum coccineum]
MVDCVIKVPHEFTFFAKDSISLANGTGKGISNYVMAVRYCKNHMVFNFHHVSSTERCNGFFVFDIGLHLLSGAQRTALLQVNGAKLCKVTSNPFKIFNDSPSQELTHWKVMRIGLNLYDLMYKLSNTMEWSSFEDWLLSSVEDIRHIIFEDRSSDKSF